ncbi:hypothetical protein [Corynebacterium sp. HMSC29G08]|uniref:hypothetical protein n=1 Tax=Corynebacterium sp. HMSC29G08 TaxID=1581069 RepID=UPI00114D0B73
MDVIKPSTAAVETAAVEEVSPRVSLVIKADIRPGYTDMLHQKMNSLKQTLGGVNHNDPATVHEWGSRFGCAGPAGGGPQGARGV